MKAPIAFCAPLQKKACRAGKSGTEGIANNLPHSVAIRPGWQEERQRERERLFFAWPYLPLQLLLHRRRTSSVADSDGRRRRALDVLADAGHRLPGSPPAMTAGSRLPVVETVKTKRARTQSLTILHPTADAFIWSPTAFNDGKSRWFRRCQRAWVEHRRGRSPYSH